MDCPVVGGGYGLVGHTQLGGQFGKRSFVQDMGEEDVAVPFPNLAERLLQTEGVALRGGIEVDVLRNQAGDVLPGVIVALMVVDPVSCVKQIYFPALDGGFQIPGELILQDIGLALTSRRPSGLRKTMS